MGLQQEILESVIQKAMEDSSFKKKLIKRPLHTIERYTGQSVKLPKGKRIVVQDQSDSDAIYVIIPVKENTEEVELSDQQLDAVAGGTIDPIIIPQSTANSATPPPPPPPEDTIDPIILPGGGTSNGG